MTPRKPKPAPAEPTGGLWIRVAANLSRRKVTWRLVEGCLSGFPLPDGAPRSLYQKAAMGFLCELWGSIAEHTADGRIVDLPDGQLEQWAGWDGTPGAFAAWLREKHLDPETGKCREWDEHAGALQTRRSADAERQRAKRERDRVAQQLLEAIAIDDATDGATNEGAKSEEVDYGGLALELTKAANRGMMDNPLIGQAFNPINSGRGDSLEVVAAFVAEKMTDWVLVARIIYTLAKAYKPQKKGDHIRSLLFFRDRTVRVYRQHMDKIAAADTLAPGEVSTESPYRKDAKTKAARTGAGALAAGKAAGLEE